MKKLFVLLIPCYCFLSLTTTNATAAAFPLISETETNITGNWTFKFNTTMGERVYDAKLKQTNNVAKGTMKGSPVTIKLNGNKVTFKTKRTTFFTEMVIQYTGKVNGNSMKGTYKIIKGFMSGSEGTWSATRKK